MKAYQTKPWLSNAERARQRATDENVPQALAGYRPPDHRRPHRSACRRCATQLPGNVDPDRDAEAVDRSASR